MGEKSETGTHRTVYERAEEKISICSAINHYKNILSRYNFSMFYVIATDKQWFVAYGKLINCRHDKFH